VGLKSLTYRLGTLNSPGPGLLPLAASVLIVVISGLMVVLSLIGKDEKERIKRSFFAAKESPRRVLLGFISLVGFRYLFPFLGFAPSAFFFIFFLARFLGHFSWKTAFFLSVLTALVSHFLFQVWLKVQMPKGIFGI
jgi:hypothetical protein